VVFSDSEAVLRAVREDADFYAYAHHVPCDDAYDALPRVCRSFVLVGGDGRRRPLCRSRADCWFYDLCGAAGDAADAARDYAVVRACATDIAGDDEYFVPRPAAAPPGDGGGEGGAPRLAVGAHPDCAALLGRGCVAGVTAVPPKRAHTCRIYVTCVSGAGAEACMAAGGVAVVGPGRPGLVADGVNGIVASADPSRATQALRRAGRSGVLPARPVGGVAAVVSVVCIVVC
jgi:hypothetical protein